MAAREQAIIRDRDRLRDYVRVRFGVEVSPLPCRLGSARSAGWANHPDGTSGGPVAWVKSRLGEMGAFKAGMPDEPDDSMFMLKGKRLVISPIARTKMFNTPLVVFPIDLNACRVAGRAWN